MKKTIFSIVFITLLLITIYLIFYKDKSTLSKRATQFALEDPYEITEIKIQQGEREAILYLDSDNKWVIDQNEANRKKISDLLVLASNIEVVAPVPLTLEDSIQEYLSQGITISFLENNKEIISYRLCSYEQHLYAQLKKSKKAFRISVRGFNNVDLTRIMSPTVNSWKKNLLFSYQSDDIRIISLEYPNNPENSFVLYKEGKKIAISGSYGEIPTQKIDPTAVSDYMYFFAGISFAPPSNLDSLASYISIEKPFFKLQIASADGNKTGLAGFRLPGPASKEFDAFQFCGLTRNNECILLNYNDFDPILLNIEDFLKN